jgi:hypothetical protein
MAMYRHKRFRGQALLEFISTVPFLLALFFLIMATSVVWMQHTMAERLAFEGARQSCAGTPYNAQTVSQWSKSWPSAPVSYYGKCENGRCTYDVSSNYVITWLMHPFSNAGVTILGRSACPENKFHPNTDLLR